MAKIGRPTKYQDSYPEQAAKLCALGATDAQLADFFGCSVASIKLWRAQHPAFSAALKLAKDHADEVVERSLYQRAAGYEHDEVDIRVVGTKVVKTPIRKHYAPDVVACIFWLKNRKPAAWRDKIEHAHSGAVGSANTMPDDELVRIASTVIERAKAPQTP